MLGIVCAGAISWAGRMVWESYHPLLGAARGLRSADPSRRANAIREVSELGVHATGEAIRSVLPVLSDPDAGARAAGAEALGLALAYAVKSSTETEATREGVTALTGLLKDPDPGVRGAAARSLGIIAGVATKPASSGGRGRGSRTPKAAPPSTSAFDPPDMVAALLALLQDRDAGVRQAALSGLRDCAPRGEEPPQPLFTAMDDESATNRAIAASILASYSSGLDPLLPVLIRHLEKDESSVRDACRTALGRIRPSSLTAGAIPSVIEGLGNGDRDVRRHMVSLLAGLKPDPRAAVPVLINVLREPDDSDEATAEGRSMSVAYEGPAQQAADAIGRIAPGTPAAGEAIAALAEVVRSGPAKRRAAAAEALGRFGKAAAQTVPTLIDYLQSAVASAATTVDGHSAATALGEIAPGTPSAAVAVTALTAALKAPSALTRDGALEALRSFGPAAAPAVEAIRRLEKDGSTPNLRKAAAETLETIRGKTK
jgi:HEAT repeat protein